MARDKFEVFEKEISKLGFIEHPYDFLYSSFEDLNTLDLIEYYRIIMLHNKKALAALSEKNRELTKRLNIETKVEEPITIKKPTIVEKTIPQNEFDDSLYTIIKTIKTPEELENLIKSRGKDLIPKIKLYIYKYILEISEEIKILILLNSLEDIKERQTILEKYKQLLTSLNKEDKKEVKEEEKKGPTIIILPSKKGSYLLNDIEEYETYKDIKNGLDKILDGRFLEGKDTKPITGKKEKLFEYFNKKTGLRILYILMDNNVIVVSELFYKDKQKSIKIDGYYDEAIRRFSINKEFLEANLSNPDFAIEQMEIIGDIYSLLESRISLSKE